MTELALGRHRKKEQRFGPSPANNYTSGYAKPGFFSRFRRRQTAEVDNPNALPSHPSPDQLRDSYGAEGTHADDALPLSDTTNEYHKYGEAGYASHQQHPLQTSGVQPQQQQSSYGNFRYGDGTYNV